MSEFLPLWNHDEDDSGAFRPLSGVPGPDGGGFRALGGALGRRLSGGAGSGGSFGPAGQHEADGDGDGDPGGDRASARDRVSSRGGRGADRGADRGAARGGLGAEAGAPEEDDVGQLIARREGYELGRKEGREAGEAEAAERIAQLGQLVGELERLRTELFGRSVQDLSQAVLLIARQIVRHELSVNSDGIENLVRSVLEGVQDEDEIIIHIAVADVRSLRDALPSLLGDVGRGTSLSIVPDTTLQPGGCIIEMSCGRIDASVDSQMAAFAEDIELWARQQAEFPASEDAA